MKKLSMLFSFVALLLVAGSALAVNITIPAGESRTDVVATNLSLRSFALTYPARSNQSNMTPFEYAFEGDRLKMQAEINSNTPFVSSDMAVNVVMFGCNATGVLSAPLTFMGGSAVFDGYVYTAAYYGEYVIPSVFDANGNCQVRVDYSYGAAAGSDDLAAAKYTDMNDVLMNPAVTLMEEPEGSLVYPILHVNQYNDASPFPQQLHITVGSVDREGQGIAGNLTKFVGSLVGVTDATQWIGSQYQQVSLGVPGNYFKVTPIDDEHGFVNLGSHQVSPHVALTLHWQLYYDQDNMPQVYQSAGDSYLFQIY